MSKQMRGIFAILCTPFNEDESLDEDSLRREVNFVVEAGAHGIVAPVMASEFQTLSDSERKTVIRV
ncbi:MAG: dihydrodipicolinate synthase family protein, partial [Anaerolineae bacterium]